MIFNQITRSFIKDEALTYHLGSDSVNSVEGVAPPQLSAVSIHYRVVRHHCPALVGLHGVFGQTVGLHNLEIINITLYIINKFVFKVVITISKQNAFINSIN